MISPNIKTKIVIIPVAIPVIALTLSLIPELFASFIAKVVVREEADKFTTLLPINMALKHLRLFFDQFEYQRGILVFIVCQ